MSSSSAAETHDKLTMDDAQTMMDVDYMEIINQNGEFKNEQVRTCMKAVERFTKIKPDEPEWVANNMKRHIEEFDSEHREELDELWSIEKIDYPNAEKVINESKMKTFLDKQLKGQLKKIRRFTSDTCKNNLIANMKEIRASLVDTVVKHGKGESTGVYTDDEVNDVMKTIDGTVDAMMNLMQATDLKINDAISGQEQLNKIQEARAQKVLEETAGRMAVHKSVQNRDLHLCDMKYYGIEKLDIDR